MAKKEQSVMGFRLMEYSRHRIEHVSFIILINFRIWNDNALLLAALLLSLLVTCDVPFPNVVGNHSTKISK